MTETVTVNLVALTQVPATMVVAAVAVAVVVAWVAAMQRLRLSRSFAALATLPHLSLLRPCQLLRQQRGH